jgi:hypothetical protein
MLNRRAFFVRTLGAMAAAACAPLVKFITPDAPITLGINWVNSGAQVAAAWEAYVGGEGPMDNIFDASRLFRELR